MGVTQWVDRGVGVGVRRTGQRLTGAEETRRPWATTALLRAFWSPTVQRAPRVCCYPGVEWEVQWTQKILLAQTLLYRQDFGTNYFLQKQVPSATGVICRNRPAWGELGKPEAGLMAAPSLLPVNCPHSCQRTMWFITRRGCLIEEAGCRSAS